jgi:hypothetical protein
LREPNPKGDNGDADPSAFLVGVEGLSRKMAVVPCPDKTSASWEKAITSMIEGTFGDIRKIYSDRDVATSSKFRRGIFRAYGITWDYIRARNKAHLAEAAIKYVRTHLSIALEANPGADWKSFLGGIVDHYNSQPLPNTDVVRSSVNKSNYMEKLSRIYRTSDPDMLFNLASAGNFTPETERVLFRFRKGQSVLLNRQADYEASKDAFTKSSRVGTYGRRVYTISKLVMKSNASLFLVPTYRLRGKVGLFYEANLLPVPFQS